MLQVKISKYKIVNSLKQNDVNVVKSKELQFWPNRTVIILGYINAMRV